MENTLADRVAALIRPVNAGYAQLFLECVHIAPADDEAEQLRKINQFWRRKLGLLSFNTINERECLDDGDYVDLEGWLTNFERIVLPTLVAHVL